MQPFIKILLSALIIYAVSEVAKRSSLFSALLASLPLVSILAMIWLWRDTHDAVRVARLSAGIFWLVIPSLALFALLPPLLLRWNLSFPIALALACSATLLCYAALIAVLKQFRIQF